MQLFAVFGTLEREHDTISKRAANHYGEANVYEVEGGLVIAAPRDTTQEIAANLGIGDDENGFTGIVVQTSYYWGYYKKGLWEWMDARSRNNGR